MLTMIFDAMWRHKATICYNSFRIAGMLSLSGWSRMVFWNVINSYIGYVKGCENYWENHGSETLGENFCVFMFIICKYR